MFFCDLSYKYHGVVLSDDLLKDEDGFSLVEPLKELHLKGEVYSCSSLISAIFINVAIVDNIDKVVATIIHDLDIGRA